MLPDMTTSLCEPVTTVTVDPRLIVAECDDLREQLADAKHLLRYAREEQAKAIRERDEARLVLIARNDEIARLKAALVSAERRAQRAGGPAAWQSRPGNAAF